MSTHQKIGLALGSGSARGWSHIGIIKALSKLGIEPEIVCGTSVGAMVGAAYVKGNMDNLEEWACSLKKLDVAKFFDINTSMRGFVDTEKFHAFLSKFIANDDDNIQDLSKIYAAVATDMESGSEVWMTKGSLLQAVWSSMSLPGLFPAIKNKGRWLIDGGLVNPVPVSVCRALGADIVIAVNLNGDIIGKHIAKTGFNKIEDNKKSGFTQKITDLVKEYTNLSFDNGIEPEEQAPSLLSAIAASVNITQDRITRSRMAGDPPDIVFSPKLAEIGLLELYRAQEAIDEGERCVQRNSSELEYILGPIIN